MGSEGFCSQRWSMSLRVKIASIWTHLCAYPLLRYSMACLANLHRLLVMVWMLGILCCFVGGSQTMTAQQMAQRFWSKLLWNSLHKLTAEHSCWSVHSDPVSSLLGAQQAHVLGLSPDQPSRHPHPSTSPRRFSISDTYQTGAWDGDHRTQRRSLYPVSPERMNRSGTTKHTLPPDCLGHRGPEKRGREDKKEWLKCIPERRRDGIEWQARTGGHWWHWQPVGSGFHSEKQAQKKQWLGHLSGREKQRLGSCAVESRGFTGMPLM